MGRKEKKKLRLEKLYFIEAVCRSSGSCTTTSQLFLGYAVQGALEKSQYKWLKFSDHKKKKVESEYSCCHVLDNWRFELRNEADLEKLAARVLFPHSLQRQILKVSLYSHMIWAGVFILSQLTWNFVFPSFTSTTFLAMCCMMGFRWASP